MKTIEISCPACGASLKVEEGRDLIYCEYCGNAIRLDDNVDRKEVVYRKVDEAEIIKNQNAIELEKIRIEETKRHHKLMLTIAGVCGFLFFVLLGFMALNGW